MESTGQTGRACPRLTGDDGGNLVEYAMLISLIVLVCLGAVSFFADNTADKLTCTASEIESATGTAC